MNQYKKKVEESTLKLATLALRVPKTKLTGKTRKRPIADARHMTIYYLRCSGEYSLETIGKCFNRDHSTVLSAIRKVNNMLSIDDRFSEQYLHFKQRMDSEAA